MKKILVIAAVNALALLACSPVATADWGDRDRAEIAPTMRDPWQRGTDWRPGIRERIVHIRNSIREGVESGQLTRREANRVRSELDAVRDELDRMRSDGYLSERERNRVLAQLDDVNRDVRRLKHNDRTARY